MFDVAGGHLARLGEVDPDELAEARGVVVAHRLRVAERLQHGVGLDDLVLQRRARLPCTIPNSNQVSSFGEIYLIYYLNYFY